MSDARWERVQELFEGALDRPPTERRSFVEAAASDDPSLRDEVLSLLAADVVEDLPADWLGALAEEEADRFAPGDRLAGRYRVRALLGRGGSGEVYEADDEELGIVVALKTLRETGSSRAALEALQLEGLLARAVWHPNVCRVYELARHEDTELWFLAMERLHGPTLEERLRTGGALHREHALALAGQMAAGLGAAHRAGVVHRDFKPGNVLLVERDGQEQAVVTDFGTGRALRAAEAETRTVSVVGTPTYMAPEQVRGEPVGPAADVYAFGLVLLQMVTGVVPFAELSVDERLAWKRDGALPSSLDDARGLDATWAAVIRRCLAPDPRERFVRVEDVVEALEGRAPETSGARPHVPVSAFPTERDPLVGREADLGALERARAGGAKLVTLVGTGGMGKTRLAVGFGVRTAESWPGGTYFCDLTEARSADGVLSAVAVTLGVQLGRGDAARQLGHAIAGRGACLVVLDNFEQVVADAPATVGRWRTLAPEATFLVTSRERLGVDGERIHAVEPLTPEQALALFAMRVRGLRPGLAPGEADGEIAREIVRLLDGIPLAIELAAARIRVMDPGAILEGMRKRFRLLAGGSGARHETLERAIDGSWDLLTAWERVAWAQCAAFEGGCTLEAAASVLDVAAWPDAPPLVDVVSSLVEKSLLRTWIPVGGAGEPMPDARFGMYVSLHEYARARLLAEAATARATEIRHGAYYAQLGEDPAMEAFDRRMPARRAVEREIDNVVTACRRAIARGDGPVVAATYRAAWRVLRARGPLETGLVLGREALACAGLDAAGRTIVTTCFGELEWTAGDFDGAILHGEAALALARELGDARLIARASSPLGRAQFLVGRAVDAEATLTAGCDAARATGDLPALCASLNALGMMHHELGHDEPALAAYGEALATARTIGDRVLEAMTLLSHGILAHRGGRLDEAAALFAAALAIHRATGNPRSEGIARLNLGSVNIERRNLEDARIHLEASRDLAHATGSRGGVGIALAGLGEMHVEAGAHDEARTHFEQALVIHRELGDRRMEGIQLGNLARIDELDGAHDRARARFEEALAIHREIGDRHYEGGCLANLASFLFDRGERREARAALDAAESILRELGALLELARARCVRAELEQAEGNAVAAGAAFDEAERLAAELGSPPGIDFGRAFVRARAALGR